MSSILRQMVFCTHCNTKATQSLHFFLSGTYRSWSKELYRFFPLETRRVVVHALHCLQQLGPIAADRILPLAITPARVIPFTAEEWVAHHDDDDDEAG